MSASTMHKRFGTLSDHITQAVLTDFPGYSAAAIEAGIAEGNRVVVERGDFTAALAAARHAVLTAAGDRNAQRLLAFYARRNQHAKACP